MLRQRLLLEEYAVQLKFIQGIKNDVADMLSRNDLVFDPTATVSTEAFEAMVHEVHANDMKVPVDYDTICLHQRDGEELEGYRTNAMTKANYKTAAYGCTSLWTKKGAGGKDRIWRPTLLRANLLEWYSRNISVYHI